MRISYQYRIKPTKIQAETIDKTLEMLRHQYNYLLAQRFDWYEMNRCSIDRCPLICHLPELKDKPNYYGQKASLTELKKTDLGTNQYILKYYKKFLKKLK